MINWTSELVIEKIQERHNCGKSLSYSLVVSDDEPLTGAARRYFTNWGNAIAAAGYDYVKIKKEARKKSVQVPRGYWSAEKIIEKIKLRVESGLSLSPHTVQNEDSKLYSAAAQTFHSWGKAVEIAGYDYLEHRKTQEWSPEKIISRIRYAYERGADISDKTVSVLSPGLYGAASTHFKSWQKAVEKAGIDYYLVSRTVRWGRVKILDMIRDAVKKGKTLSMHSFPEGFKAAVYDHFDSWDDALAAAGFSEKPWTEVDKNIKNNIREYRKKANLSEQKLGQKIGVSHRTISMLELSQYIDPRVSFAIKLSRILGRTVEEVFVLTGQAKSADESH